MKDWILPAFLVVKKTGGISFNHQNMQYLGIMFHMIFAHIGQTIPSIVCFDGFINCKHNIGLLYNFLNASVISLKGGERIPQKKGGEIPQTF